MHSCGFINRTGQSHNTLANKQVAFRAQRGEVKFDRLPAEVKGQLHCHYLTPLSSMHKQQQTNINNNVLLFPNDNENGQENKGLNLTVSTEDFFSGHHISTVRERIDHQNITEQSLKAIHRQWNILRKCGGPHLPHLVSFRYILNLSLFATLDWTHYWLHSLYLVYLDGGQYWLQ